MAGMWKPYGNAEELIDAAIGGRLERFMSEAFGSKKAGPHARL